MLPRRVVRLRPRRRVGTGPPAPSPSSSKPSALVAPTRNCPAAVAAAACACGRSILSVLLRPRTAAAPSPPHRLVRSALCSSVPALGSVRHLSSTAANKQTPSVVDSPLPPGDTPDSSSDSPASRDSVSDPESDPEREIIVLAPLLTSGGKVANRIMNLAITAFVGSDSRAPKPFVRMLPEAQSAILVANSILGNHSEVMALWDSLTEEFPGRDNLALASSAEFHYAVLKSHLKTHRTQAALRLFSRIPDATPAMLSLLISTLIVNKDFAVAEKTARRYTGHPAFTRDANLPPNGTPPHAMLTRRTLAYLDAAGIGADIDPSLSLLQTRDGHLEYLQYYAAAQLDCSTSPAAAVRAVGATLETIVKLYSASTVQIKKVDPTLRAQRQDRVVVAHSIALRALVAAMSAGGNVRAKRGVREKASAGQAEAGLSIVEMLEEMEALMANIRMLGLVPSLHCYTILIHAYYLHGGLERIIQCFNEMQNDGIKPDQAVYNILIRAYSLENMHSKALELFYEMVNERGLYPNVRCLSSIMGTFTLLGDMVHCVNLFERLEACGFKPDHTMFHVVMSGFSLACDVGNVLAWYDRLLSAELRPNVVTYTIVMSAISRSANPEATRRWYERVFSSSIRPNVHTYTLLIHDRARRGDLDSAVLIYNDLLRAKMKPTAVTYTTLLNAYVNHTDTAVVTSGTSAISSSNNSNNTSEGHHDDVLATDADVAQESVEAAADPADSRDGTTNSMTPADPGSTPPLGDLVGEMAFLDRNPHVREAFELCHRMMQAEARPDVAVFHVVMKMLSSLGMAPRAIAVYEQILSARSNTVMRRPAYGKRGDRAVIARVVEPDETMYLSALSLYAAVGDFAKVEATLNALLYRGSTVGLREYPTATVLQTVLRKLVQMMWFRSFAKADEVAESTNSARETVLADVLSLFRRLFNDFVAFDDDGAAASAGGTRKMQLVHGLHERLVRDLLKPMMSWAGRRVDWSAEPQTLAFAVMVYIDMAKHQVRGGYQPTNTNGRSSGAIDARAASGGNGAVAATPRAPLELATREKLFTRLIEAATAVADAQAPHGVEPAWAPVVDAYAASMATGVGDGDAEYFAAAVAAGVPAADVGSGAVLARLADALGRIGVPAATGAIVSAAAARALLVRVCDDAGMSVDAAARVWAQLRVLRAAVDADGVYAYAEALARAGRWTDLVDLMTRQCLELGLRGGGGSKAAPDGEAASLFERVFRLFRRYGSQSQVAALHADEVRRFWSMGGSQ
ncbi:hypothetical protein HDU84_001009 [Entophlyctis sp. JEL0112]|nr:hypothetical protein HDU84_001009 [Entophlyctis sp. JEL0112]